MYLDINALHTQPYAMQPQEFNMYMEAMAIRARAQQSCLTGWEPVFQVGGILDYCGLHSALPVEQ